LIAHFIGVLAAGKSTPPDRPAWVCRFDASILAALVA
jgi:hypothetical protein